MKKINERMSLCCRVFNFEDIKRASELFFYDFNTNEITLKSTGECVRNLTALVILQIKFANMWSRLKCFPNSQSKTIWGEKSRNSYYYLVLNALNKLKYNSKLATNFYDELLDMTLKDENRKEIYDIYSELFFNSSNKKIIEEFLGKLEEILTILEESCLLSNSRYDSATKFFRNLSENAYKYSGAYENNEGIYRDEK